MASLWIYKPDGPVHYEDVDVEIVEQGTLVFYRKFKSGERKRVITTLPFMLTDGDDETS